MPSRLALGTAQFGLAYGVSNEAGKVTREEAAAILACAREAGMDTLDTAIDYGDSEARLGDIGVRDWRITSKLPALPDGCADVGAWVERALTGSLQRLKADNLSALLLHRPMQLLGARGDELYRALLACKARGHVERIGISIYDTEELDGILQRYDVDLVQAPFNVVDRRLVASGWMARLSERGTEIHVRSAFLQGLLLMPRARRAAKFERWSGLWASWQAWLERERVTPLQACLAGVLAERRIARAVVGVESVRQLREILSAVATAAPVPPESFATADRDLVDPSRWSTL